MTPPEPIMTNQHRRTQSNAQVEINITNNVDLRVVTPQERKLLAESAIKPEDIEQPAAGRLLAALRDEAIWQYRLGRGRGLVVWRNDHSVRYFPADHSDSALSSWDK